MLAQDVGAVPGDHQNQRGHVADGPRFLFMQTTLEWLQPA